MSPRLRIAIYRALEIKVQTTIPWELPEPRLRASAGVMLEDDPDEVDFTLTLQGELSPGATDHGRNIVICNPSTTL